MNRVAIVTKYIKLPVALVLIGLPSLALSFLAKKADAACDHVCDHLDDCIRNERRRLNEVAKVLECDERAEEIEEQVRAYRESLLAKDTAKLVAIGKQYDSLKGL